MIARFRISGYEQRQIDGVDGDWLAVLTFAKVFTEGIVGEATTVFLSAGEEGNRSYVATERISGRLADGDDSGEGDDADEGTLVVQHGGLESDPSTWFGHIVPGTGTGPFAGWTGSARIEHDADGAYFDIRTP